MSLTVVEIPLAAGSAAQYSVAFGASGGGVLNITGYEAEVTWRNCETPDTIHSTIGTNGATITNGGAAGNFTFQAGPFANAGTYEGHFRWRENSSANWQAACLLRATVEEAR